MRIIAGAIASLFTGLRLVLRDVFYRLGAERRRQHLVDLNEFLAWASERGLTLEQMIVAARHLGYRRQARMLTAMRDATSPRLPSPVD